MELFSERYNYIKPQDIMIRENITPEIQNAICSCYDRMRIYFDNHDVYSYRLNAYLEVEKYLWCNFLNQREYNFAKGHAYEIVATKFLEDVSNPWYKKLDIVEFTIKYLSCVDEILIKNDGYRRNMKYVSEFFVRCLNREFKRLNFAYRVVNNEIVEITSEQEIKTIEIAVENSSKNIQEHLSKAIELYAKRPSADYRNSIKESISAVEAFCRKQTNKNTLGDALKMVQNKGVNIPQMLITAFEKLYVYTNQPSSGIRHALMEEETDSSKEEAYFMLVSCSAFINYLKAKLGNEF